VADLTTEFAAYLAALYDAGVGTTANNRTDLTTLLAKDLPTVRADDATQVDDINTMYLVYLV
jgi:hypothetical protein